MAIQNLDRFLTAQQPLYAQVINELRNGKKQTHWMWFIFPQIIGLGYSEISKYYAIHGREEAEAFLFHPILGVRLQECTQIVLTYRDKTAVEIFGSTDALKFHSCMTLFAEIAKGDAVYNEALSVFYKGTGDKMTKDILKKLHRGEL